MHVFIFSRLFSQAIINIQDLTIVTTIASFCWGEQENWQCGLPFWKSNHERKAIPRGTVLSTGEGAVWSLFDYGELTLQQGTLYDHTLHSLLTSRQLVDVPGISIRSSWHVHKSPTVAEPLQKGSILLLACPHGKNSFLHSLSLHKRTHIALNWECFQHS